MKKSKFIVANWKMNLTINSSKKLLKSLENTLINLDSNVKIVICPQFPLIPLLNDFLGFDSRISIGAQDSHYEINGAHTGETSVELLKELNCKYIISGHSERRSEKFESSKMVRKKIARIFDYSLIPILCVGETLEDRKSNNYLNIISRQLLESMPENINQILVAYEPIWSIGTGLTPDLSQISEVAKHIKLCINESNKKVDDLSVLYGGSVNSNNFLDIINLNDIDGSLVGGASIKSNEFNKMLKNLI
ncbi:triose-phosphate isomerase [Rickettsiales bacterium]|nr:triose-phosphate isomerase [Rickettsiales bacterium]